MDEDRSASGGGGHEHSGGPAASDLAQALIGSPIFDQAVSAALSARDKASEAQRAAMGALNLSSADDSERLERRLRMLSERLEEVEDRLDEIGAEVRALRPPARPRRPASKRSASKKPGSKGSGSKKAGSKRPGGKG